MADIQELDGAPSDISPGDKAALEHTLQRLEEQSAATNKARAKSLGGAHSDPMNKMSTSSATPNTGRRTKGGGAPYATSDNFAPQTAPETPSKASNGTPTSTPTTAAPGTGGSVEEDLQRMEAQQAQQALSEYDDQVPKGDMREPENMKKADPFLAEQQQKDEKAGAKIPTADLRDPGAQQQKGFKGLKQKAKKFAKKKKGKLIAEGLGVGGIFFLLMLLMFLLGALLIPHFVSNMMGYEFLRLTRAAYNSNQRVVEEQVADAANSGTPDGVKAESEYGKLANGEVNPLMDDGLTPDAMNEAMKAAGDTGQFVEDAVKNADGTETLKAITLGPQAAEDAGKGAEPYTADVKGGMSGGDIAEPTVAGFTNAEVPDTLGTAVGKGLEILDPAKGDGIVYQQEVEPVDVGEVGLTDSGLNPDDYPDKMKDSAAEAKIETDTEAAVDDSTGVGTSDLSDINNDEESGQKMLEADMQNPSDVAEIVKTDGNLPSNLINLINSDFVQSALSSVANKIGEFLNPASGKLIPLCMIYEGSKFNGPTAQAQSNEDQRAAILTMAVNDQQERGSPYVTSQMVSAESWKLNGDPRSGGVQDSMAIRRASGEKVDTSSQLSAEGAPLGNTQTSGNIIAALGIPFADQLAGALDAICPAITNIWVNLGLGVLNLTFTIIIGLFTGGGGDAAEAGLEAAAEGGAEEAANVAGETIIDNILSDSVTDSSSSGFSALLDFGKGAFKVVKATGKETRKFIITGGLIAMATFAAKFYVMAQSGILNSGLATGQQYDDQVDQGGNILANAQVANGYGGRPLTDSESVQVQADDNKIAAAINASKSPYQRYLALSNPQSLASIMLDRLAINFNYKFFGTAMADMGNIFNPATLMPQVFFGGLSGQANAASSADTQDYGDVQQGYSDAEYALIAKEPTYKIPSENEYYLYQNPSEEAEVAQTYSPCFTQSVATLLSNKDIVRDKGGAVDKSQGLCSPDNLGPYNPQYGDLVFRYRLSLGYTTSVKILQGLAYANGTLH